VVLNRRDNQTISSATTIHHFSAYGLQKLIIAITSSNAIIIMIINA